MTNQRELNYLLCGIAIGGLSWAAGNGVAKMGRGGASITTLKGLMGAEGTLSAIPPALANEARENVLKLGSAAGGHYPESGYAPSERPEPAALTGLVPKGTSSLIRAHGLSPGRRQGGQVEAHLKLVRHKPEGGARASTIYRSRMGLASWYDRASCLEESGQFIMANGQALDDEAFTAAMWDVPFGTRVIVTNLANNRSVSIIITDRGPAMRLVREGRIIDLSRRAFSEIASLDAGLVKVRIEEEQKR